MNDQSTNADTPRARQPGDGARLLTALNLSPEQRAQIAVVRQQAEANRRAATMRLRRARRALDEAIYADAVDDVQINARTREVADAQAAVIRLLADTELRVRRLLTPEQLDTFRALRQRARARQNSNRRFQQQDLNNARPRRLSRQARP